LSVPQLNSKLAYTVRTVTIVEKNKLKGLRKKVHSHLRVL